MRFKWILALGLLFVPLLGWGQSHSLGQLKPKPKTPSHPKVEAQRYLVTAKTQVVREEMGTYQAGLDEAFLPLNRAGSINKNLEIRIGQETINLPIMIQVMLQKTEDGLALWVRSEAKPSTQEQPHRVERHLNYGEGGGSRVMTVFGDPKRMYAVHLAFDVRPEEKEIDLLEAYRGPGIVELVPLQLRLTRLSGGMQDVVDEVPLNAAMNDGAVHRFQRQVAVSKPRQNKTSDLGADGEPVVIAGKDGTFHIPAGKNVVLDRTGAASPEDQQGRLSLYRRRQLKDEQRRLDTIQSGNPELTGNAAAQPYLGLLADDAESDASEGPPEILKEYIRITLTPENRLSDDGIACRVDIEAHLVGRRGFLTPAAQTRTFHLNLHLGKSETVVFTQGDASARIGYRVEVALPNAQGEGLIPGDGPASSSWFTHTF